MMVTTYIYFILCQINLTVLYLLPDFEALDTSCCTAAKCSSEYAGVCSSRDFCGDVCVSYESMLYNIILL